LEITSAANPLNSQRAPIICFIALFCKISSIYFDSFCFDGVSAMNYAANLPLTFLKLLAHDMRWQILANLVESDRRVHWSFPDSAAVTGSEAEQFQAFLQTARELSTHISYLRLMLERQG
jgi:hypothetical protein